MTFGNLAETDLISARSLGHDLGLQILVDETTPSKYSVTGGVANDHVSLDTLEQVWAHLKQERLAAVIYEDTFVVVYKHRFHALVALNESREQQSVSQAAGWCIYAHDDGALLSFGLDCSGWVLSGDISALLKAGVLDCRTQWTALHTRLNAAIGYPVNVIPYVATTDAYTISFGLRHFVSSKWPRVDFGSPSLEMPVIQVSIPDYYYREDLGRSGSGLLAVAVMGALITRFEPEATKEECFQLVAERVKAHKVQTIILHEPQNLEQHASIHWMLEDLVDRAQLWGCKVVLVGSPEFCWHLRTQARRFSFDLIVPSKPVCMEPSFFEALRQFIRSAGYTVELDLTPEIGALIWSASGQDRHRAIALCRAMAFDCNEREVGTMDRQSLERITQYALV